MQSMQTIEKRNFTEARAREIRRRLEEMVDRRRRAEAALTRALRDGEWHDAALSFHAQLDRLETEERHLERELALLGVDEEL